MDENNSTKTNSSPLKADSKFRIEYSSTFLAAKALQKQSVKSSYFSALELECNASSAETYKPNESDDGVLLIAEIFHKIKEEASWSPSESSSRKE